MLQVGDAVRLRPDAVNMDLMEPWADLTGLVAAVHDSGEHVTVIYPEPFSGFSPPLPASDFRRDTPLDATLF